MHALETIANTGSKPMQKQPTPTEGMDARMKAAVLVASVLAHVRNDDKVWHGFAVQLINGTTDFRAAFVKGMDEQLKDMRKANTEAVAALGKDGKPNPTKEETRLAGKRVGTATVYVSKLRSIANAFNSGATVEGLIHHAAETGRGVPETLTVDLIGWTVIAEYAGRFSTSKAGRKADPWLVKFGKWLDSAGKVGEDATPEEKADYEAAVAFFNSRKG